MMSKYFKDYEDFGNFTQSYYGPMTRYHGGNCCGVKEINGFSSKPRDEVDPYTPETKEQHYWHNRDDEGEYVASYTALCTEERPRETALERLKAVIKNVLKYQKSVLFQVYLSEHQKVFTGWDKALEDLGFRVVTSFKNGNTGCILTSYILVYKDYEIVKEK